MMRRILQFVKGLMIDAEAAPDTDYRAGFLDACEQVEEYIEDQLWDQGEADD